MATSAKQSEMPRVGRLRCGPLDSIADVSGILVGHCTLSDGPVQTGVTVVYPHSKSLFLNKVPAAATVFNGFGKSVGLIQVDELGVLETPIGLTNTFGVPAVAQAQIKQAIAMHPEIGRAWSTVNPLVFECNDGYLNDIQVCSVQPEHYRQACESATAVFKQGAVGAGRGMSCFGLKGGIGSSSRKVNEYTVGVLVLSNFGKIPHLTICGQSVGAKLAEENGPEKGSIIMLVATDAPLDARQLRRLSSRAGVGLARTGSFMGHGSGDIALAFSTAYTIPHDCAVPMPAQAMLHETLMDGLFEATADACEQAILSSLWHAESVSGRDDHRRQRLLDVWNPK